MEEGGRKSGGNAVMQADEEVKKEGEMKGGTRIMIMKRRRRSDNASQ